MAVQISDVPSLWHHARRTDDQTYNGEVQTVKVIDTRPRAGDTAANSRRIPAFPFYDSDDTTLYADNYDSDPANRVSSSCHSLRPGF